MKAIMVMYDSLNRKMLEPYGCDWIKTPNFARLAKKAVTFDCNYVGSMPCMPARRELHTGRYNFLHRSWGPLEHKDFYEYTLMPTHMNCLFGTDELQSIELCEPFSFTKGCRTMKIKAKGAMNPAINFGSKLFCLEKDPLQEHPLRDDEKEAQLANEMVRLMEENDCPEEYFELFGFSRGETVTPEKIAILRRAEYEDRIPESLAKQEWERGAVNMYPILKRFLPKEEQEGLDEKIAAAITDGRVTAAGLFGLVEELYPPQTAPMVYYFCGMACRTE